MGVQGGHTFVRECARKERLRRNGANISSLHLSLEEAVGHHISRYRAEQNVIILDVLGYFGYLLRSLPKTHYRYGNIAKYAKGRTDYGTKERAQAAIISEFCKEVVTSISRLANAYPSIRIIAVLDHSGGSSTSENAPHEASEASQPTTRIGRAKLKIWTERRATRIRASEHLRQAMADLDEMIVASPATASDAAADGYQIVRSKKERRNDKRRLMCSLPAQGAKSIRRGTLNSILSRIMDSAWSDVHGNIWSEMRRQMEAVAGSQCIEEQEYSTQQDWSTINHHISASSSRICLIHSRDEADLTISNVSSHLPPTSKAAIVSSDSDYFFLSHPSRTPSLISYTSFQRHKRWELFDLPSLYSNTALWPWQDLDSRCIAALLAGQDYLPKGLPKIGLATIREFQLVTAGNASVTSVSQRLLVLHQESSQATSKWSIARADFEKRRQEAEVALTTMRTARHDLVPASQIEEAKVAAQHQADNPTAPVRQSQRGDGIKLRFKRPPRDRNTPVPDLQEDDTLRRQQADRPLNTSRQPRNHHHQSFRDLCTQPEAERTKLVSAKDLPAWVSGVDDEYFSDDEECKLRKKHRIKSKPKKQYKKQQTAEDTKTKTTSKKIESLAGQIYPIYTHSRILRSVVRGSRNHGGRPKQAAKIFPELVRLITICEKLAVSTTISPCLQHYFQNIAADPAFAGKLSKFKSSTFDCKQIWRYAVQLLVPLGAEKRVDPTTVDRFRRDLATKWSDNDPAVHQHLTDRLAMIDEGIIIKASGITSGLDIHLLEAVHHVLFEDCLPPLPAFANYQAIWTMDSLFATAMTQWLRNNDEYSKSLQRRIKSVLEEEGIHPSASSKAASAIREWLWKTDFTNDEDVPAVEFPDHPRLDLSDAGLSDTLRNVTTHFRQSRLHMVQCPLALSLIVRNQEPSAPPSSTYAWFAHIGHRFSVAIDPSFCHFGMTKIYYVLSNPAHIVASLTSWLNDHWNKSPSIVRSVSTLQCFNLARGRCGLEVNTNWMTRCERWTQEFMRSVSSPNKDDFPKARLEVFDILFKRVLPKYQIYAGSFKTDGIRVNITAMDISKAKLPKNLESDCAVKKIDVPKEWTVPDFFKAAVTLYQKSFSNLQGHLERTSIAEPSTAFKKKGKWWPWTFERIFGSNRRGVLRKGMMQDRPLTILSDFREESTRRGIPTDMLVLRPDTVEVIEEKMKELLTACEQDTSGDWLSDLRILGLDTGIVCPSAMAINDPINGTSSTLLTRRGALENIRRSGTRFKQDLLQRPGTNKLEGRAGQLAKAMLESSHEWSNDSYMNNRRRKAWVEQYYQQLRRHLFPPDRPRVPILFSLGDSSGFSRGSGSTKRQQIDYSHSIFRDIRKKCIDNGLPILFVVVGEAYSSQVCPDVSCTLNIPQVDSEEVKLARARLFHPFHRGCLDQCLRVLQCEKCKKVYHRDTAAAINIAFIAWHMLRFGEHPWRKGDDD